jgi:hypothetical protein
VPIRYAVCFQVRMKAFETWALGTLKKKHYRSINLRIVQRMRNQLLHCSFISWRGALDVNHAGQLSANFTLAYA